jgi:PHP family Zn ribbon phosphoesterase
MFSGEIAWKCRVIGRLVGLTAALAHRVLYLLSSNTSRANFPQARPPYLTAIPLAYQRKPAASVAGFFFSQPPDDTHSR